MIPYVLFPSAAIGDKLLIAADPILLLLAVLTGAGMVLWSVWLSHRPQPTPNPAAWQNAQGARRKRRAKR